MTDFDDIPVKEDRKVISRELLDLDGIAACRVRWLAEPLAGESLYLRQNDVAHLNEDELKALVRSHFRVMRPRQVMLVFEGDFLVVSFNFATSFTVRSAGREV